jgi:hypothetical protein
MFVQSSRCRSVEVFSCLQVQCFFHFIHFIRYVYLLGIDCFGIRTCPRSRNLLKEDKINLAAAH